MKHIITIYGHNHRGKIEEISSFKFDNMDAAMNQYFNLVKTYYNSDEFIQIEWDEKAAEGGSITRGEFKYNPTNY